jgi:hypothetical protein
MQSTFNIFFIHHIAFSPAYQRQIQIRPKLSDFMPTVLASKQNRKRQISSFTTALIIMKISNFSHQVLGLSFTSLK